VEVRLGGNPLVQEVFGLGLPGRDSYSECEAEPCNRENGLSCNGSVTAGKKVGRAVLCPPRRARSARPTTHD